MSLAVGLLMFFGKTAAWWITGSTAILSDAAESVLHVFAVAFAAFSLWLSRRPASDRYPYGYERVSFFSAGFEGALIILAASAIIVAAVQQWIAGLEFRHLGAGTLVIAGAALVNALLGWYVVRTGRRTHSLILVANGKHILTDAWTSFGVIAGLLLVMATGWRPFDPLCAIAVAVNILWSGGRLMRDSIGGLMDYADPRTGAEVESKVDAVCAALGVQHHGLRCRHTGGRLLVELHLMFPYAQAIGEAHRLATEFEDRLVASLDMPSEVMTHLEAAEDHARVHGNRVKA
jgi:cation diffusion facilitator family transporter